MKMLVKVIEAYLIVGLVLTGLVMYLVSNTEQYKEDGYSIPVIITVVVICIIAMPVKTVMCLIRYICGGGHHR